MSDTQLNPDALEAAADAVTMAAGACGVELYGADEDIFAESAVSAYLAAARRWLATTEELEALRAGSIIRSKRGIVRERFSTGWLAIGGDGIATSEDLAMIDGGHELLHDGQTDD